MTKVNNIKRRCDGKCNDCCYNPKSVVAYQILQLIDERDESIIKEINTLCPNMSCCPECGADDFCHVEGCSFIIQNG